MPSTPVFVVLCFLMTILGALLFLALFTTSLWVLGKAAKVFHRPWVLVMSTIDKSYDRYQGSA